MGAEDIDLELGPQGLSGDVLERPKLPEPTVVEQPVDPPPGVCQRGLDGGPDGGRVGEVELHGGEPLGRQPLHVFLLAGTGDHAVAARAQALRDRVTDPARCPGDQDASVRCACHTTSPLFTMARGPSRGLSRTKKL